jgi:hypothetical protein
MRPPDNFEAECKLLGFDPWQKDQQAVISMAAGTLCALLTILYAKGEVQGEKNAFDHASMIATDAAKRRRETIHPN